MDKIHRFAAYLAEGFGSEVPVWRGTPDLVALEHAPAAILIEPKGELPHAEASFVGDGLAVIENPHCPPRSQAPENFRVAAIMPVYNEADIILSSLRYLIDQGIAVYVIDNWSNDGTYEIAQTMLGDGVIRVERYPTEGPSPTYEWRSILGRIETVAESIAADWFLFHDADERRESPWPDLDLRSAIYYADQCGFNCVDHIVLNFHPTGEPFDETQDLTQQLRYFEFSGHEGHFHQRKAWKKQDSRVSLAPTAGHDIRFPNRLVYPFKFLMKHYPIRSQEHGVRKVLQDRAKRWSAEERALGWHKQYDDLITPESFVREPSSLTLFDPATFYKRYLIERLSGIGVFHAIPWWATGPRYNSAK